MSEFYDPDRNRMKREYSHLAEAQRQRSSWAWVWALVVIGFVAVIIVAGHRSEQTAQNPNPPTTTGQASSTLPAAPSIAKRPTSPPATTGQGSSQ